MGFYDFFFFLDCVNTLAAEFVFFWFDTLDNS